MCGILGFTGQKDLKKVADLQQLIAHRGRDEFIQNHLHNLNLGMNRLSIKDLSPKLYPMQLDELILIYNGEIYNYQRLKDYLREQGYNFNTDWHWLFTNELHKISKMMNADDSRLKAQATIAFY